MGFPPFTLKHHTAPYPGIDPSLPAVSAAGKTILITGGGSGIGPRIAEAFAVAGSKQIALLGRTKSTLENTKSTLESKHSGLNVLTFVADITDASAVNAAFQGTKAAFGPIDIFVSNAAFLPEPVPIKDMVVSDFVQGLNTNVVGNLITTQAFLSTAASSNAVLIHVTTGAVHFPSMPNYSGYQTSKTAALKFFEAVQAENPNLRVMNVHPGYLPTDMNAKSAKGGLGSDNSIPFDHMDLPGHFIVWAASPEGAFLEGKLIWSNWDVEELKERKEELQGGEKLTMVLNGWPRKD
ncbi:Short-chain dehydrogenase/reductase SDR [Penicillium samsonianum]|uniref:Short-chain dehydrogenase/reductase SDR n=1 Tax=Penicillium samsonianum TaxID=1882272 RepID=UPI002548FB15|nr:Short-chain dehydrogenase/reductase SDR [Penicillium samsonianum]KAJ6142925.1 Short-chain dehydrogenase/reductase SDR [Penicillium samsonianum]